MYRRKMVAFLLVLAMVLGITPAAGAESNSEVKAALDSLEQGFAEMYGDSEETRIAAELINCYRNDEMFEMHYEYDSEDALGMVATVVNGAIRRLHEPQPQWTDGQVYGAEGVPTYSQVQTSSCGAASALQVIVQQGGADNIPGNTYNDKELTLISETQYGKGLQPGVVLYEIPILINKYKATVGHRYVYLSCDSATTNFSRFYQTVLNSFSYDCPIILHTIKKFVDYYPSTDNGGHYIVGTHYFTLSDQLAVNDCHYSPTYNGLHYISMNCAYNSVSIPFGDTTRYLVYGEYE